MQRKKRGIITRSFCNLSPGKKGNSRRGLSENLRKRGKRECLKSLNKRRLGCGKQPFFQGKLEKKSTEPDKKEYPRTITQ